MFGGLPIIIAFDKKQGIERCAKNSERITCGKKGTVHLNIGSKKKL
jgi:hypothetical protein